jgi:hypothetical protein
MIHKELPLRLELPSSFVYQALFESTPIYLSRVLEHITMTKHETVPLCQRIYKQLCQLTEDDHLEEDVEAEKRVVLDHLDNKDRLNAVTKDAIAVLSNQTVVSSSQEAVPLSGLNLCVSIQYLERGQSLFRKDWQVEDEFIRQNLSVTSHPMFLPFVLEFTEEFSRKNGLRKDQVHLEMQDAVRTI